MSSPVYDLSEFHSLLAQQEKRINALEKDILDLKKLIADLIFTLDEIL